MRRLAQLEMREKSTPLGKALAAARDLKSQPLLSGKTPAQAAASLQRTNPFFNTAGSLSRVAGPLVTGVGVLFSLNNIANAPEGQKVQAATKEGSVWAGALGGGAVGAQLGAVGGPWGGIRWRNRWKHHRRNNRWECSGQYAETRSRSRGANVRCTHDRYKVCWPAARTLTVAHHSYNEDRTAANSKSRGLFKGPVSIMPIL